MCARLGAVAVPPCCCGSEPAGAVIKVGGATRADADRLAPAGVTAVAAAAAATLAQVTGKVLYNGKSFDEFVPERSAAYISQAGCPCACLPACSLGAHIVCCEHAALCWRRWPKPQHASK